MSDDQPIICALCRQGTSRGYFTGGRPSTWCHRCTEAFKDAIRRFNAEQEAKQRLAAGKCPF